MVNRRKTACKRKTKRGRKQKGKGVPLSVIAAIPKVGFNITKQLEKRAEREAKKLYVKHLDDVKKGKAKDSDWAGERNTCHIM